MSNTPLFQSLSAALNTADSLNFSITPASDGRLRVVITPLLNGEAPTDGDAAEIRAALSLPLVITDTAESLDESFCDLLRDYASRRAGLSAITASLDAISKATEKAGKKVAGNTSQASGNTTAQQPTNTAPNQTAAAASDDDILL